ncbi:iron-siderophore ABC transporter substrate-binding protein [Alkalimarinus coralli]|uniref:ABC transporter substrate-binding protein n=1 Tax=Alkalimarinus coralli TaxID=2935863 RepID=UPI00202B692E|nr:iron-siderophore ABC transporter substrate-binding protein [Alkalimarinus coralli]
MNRFISLLLFAILSLWLPAISSHAQPVSITDSLGVHHFDESPTRIITLPWSITEMLLELKVTPLGVAGIEDYKKWVARPEIPQAVFDIGSRNEPNIERIAELKPDLIVISFQQRDLIETLSAIAPVLYFETFSASHNNYQTSKDIFIRLAKLLNRERFAIQRLSSMDKRVSELRAELQKHFKGEIPKVTPIRFNNTALAWIYGENSMPQYALELLGIQPGLPQPNSQWGITQKKVIELGRVNEGAVLHFLPYEQADTLFSTPLWRAMPFVRKNKFAAVRPTWTYGGPVSVLYLAEAMTASLLSIHSN